MNELPDTGAFRPKNTYVVHPNSWALSILRRVALYVMSICQPVNFSQLTINMTSCRRSQGRRKLYFYHNMHEKADFVHLICHKQHINRQQCLSLFIYSSKVNALLVETGTPERVQVVPLMPPSRVLEHNRGAGNMATCSELGCTK